MTMFPEENVKIIKTHNIKEFWWSKIL